MNFCVSLALRRGANVRHIFVLTLLFLHISIIKHGVSLSYPLWGSGKRYYCSSDNNSNNDNHKLPKNSKDKWKTILGRSGPYQDSHRLAFEHIKSSSFNNRIIMCSYQYNKYLIKNTRINPINTHFGNRVRLYSGCADAFSINPFFVSGLIDAEGTFIISVKRSTRDKTKWIVQASMQIEMNSRDLALLITIQNFFKGAGYFSHKLKSNKVNYSITNLSDLTSIIIPHFNNYPLQSCKSIDFKLWAQCVKMMNNKQHLTVDGLNEILSLKSVLNRGLTEQIKSNFLNVKYLVRPEYQVSDKPLNPYWVSGFSEGDSSFFVHITKTNRVMVVYQIELHSRELPLLYKIQDFFGGVGNVQKSSTRSLARYSVVGISDLVNNVLPHFTNFELVGGKQPNFIIWSKILTLVNSKSHLTPEGLNQIRELKLNMNKYSTDNLSSHLEEEPSKDSKKELGLTGLSLYMYNRDKSILYYCTANRREFLDNLNIHYITFEKHFTKGTYYLGKYLFTGYLVPTAKFKNLSLSELALMLEKDRKSKRKA